MGATTLQDIMEKRFREIKTNFKRASVRNNIIFDEDIFIDTYIKCCDYLNNTDMNEKQIIQYFWVSFINNIRKESRKKIYKVKEEDLENALEIIDEEYDERRYKVYDFIINHVKNNFDELSFKIWYMHFVENISYEDLIKLGYNNINFHNIFRNINNSIKLKLPKENKEYKSIIKEIFRKNSH